MAPVHGSWVSLLSLHQSRERVWTLSDHPHSLTVANQMLSLVGSIQPDPFSPEHAPQARPDRAQSPQPPPHPVLPDPIESDATDDEELDTVTARPPPVTEDRDERRGLKEVNEDNLTTREKKKRQKEKEKRKRKEDEAVTKSEHRPKRKKAS